MRNKITDDYIKELKKQMRTKEKIRKNKPHLYFHGGLYYQHVLRIMAFYERKIKNLTGDKK